MEMEDAVTRKRKASNSALLHDDNNDESSPSSSCPYLDTVQRSLLDFDFEPACSVSLESGPHIYACLVCGKFFRGKGAHTPAYTHAAEESHFCFVHLTRGTFHCLPDDYEIRDPSLLDIRAALRPTYTASEIAQLDRKTEHTTRRDLFGRKYLPGFVGLNNLQKTDGINAVVQALAHVRPLRDYFLAQSPNQQQQQYYGSDPLPSSARGNAATKSRSSSKHRGGAAYRSAQHVTQAFGDLVRKLWSHERFKSTVDPHKLVQAISAASKKKFNVGKQVEAGEFMAWLLHQLHLGTGGGKKAGSSIVHKIFQGAVQVQTKQAKKQTQTSSSPDAEEDDRGGSDVGEGGDDEYDNNKQKDVEMEEAEKQKAPAVVVEETTVETNFLQLTLDIPEKPLFRDDDGGLVIPQEPLANVLKKFDGVSFSDALSRSGAAQRKRYKLLRLPNYLILHLSRFKTNNYSREKNPTIVAFPVKNFDLSDYVHPEGGRKSPPTEEQVRAMSIKELKSLLSRYGRKDLADRAVEKVELVEAAIDFVTKSLPDLLTDKYDLVANITHESPADVGREGKTDPLQEGSYKCHVQHLATKQWYEMQDLHVQEIMAQQIGLSESYVLIFRRTGID